MFEQPFQPEISNELRRRRNFDSVQSVFHPHVRVTSLIRGNLHMPPFNKNQDLFGFTLGIPDVNQINNIESYFNLPGQDGTVVGLTYTNGGKAVPVRIGTGTKKLPPPGVTDVSIETNTSKMAVWRATINLKFYGKEQYNFIYQTFLRPGNPILIEYGHTRADSKYSSAVKDLGFFTDLNPQGLTSTKKDLFLYKTTSERSQPRIRPPGRGWPGRPGQPSEAPEIAKNILCA